MPEDVLEWGPSEPHRTRSWTRRLALPPLSPYLLAGAGAIAYFISISQPWRVYKLEPAVEVRHEYALTLGLGLGYTVATLVLAGLFPMVLLGSRRMKRVATGTGVAIGVMCAVQLIAVVTVAGKDSVWYEGSRELRLTVGFEPGLYAAFAAVAAFVAAVIAVHHVRVRRSRTRSAARPEYADEDAVRDLTVSGS